MIPPEYRRLVIQQNGDVLPTLLVDGYVVGVWRPRRERWWRFWLSVTPAFTTATPLVG
ncbi:DNA glycosylase AlkZ-like family protein [Deinococcus aestuarii]|uniref:DNA glycosylase AlkZ-like family protein n=1 Tax=Deinococcus aestuarii TaxID=2774531 RepID=UPI001C0BC8A4